METVTEREFATYPRNFLRYRWFRPILVGLLFIAFYLLLASLVFLITSLGFHTTVTGTGYDDLNYYTAAGAFYNCSLSAIYIPSFLFAALIIKDRPFSSYLSSMGGWRWKIFLKTAAAGTVIAGIPIILRLLLNGKVGEVLFTPGGLILLVLLMPLVCIAEELLYRGYISQTVSSWFRLPVIGLIVQTIAFAAVHPYNLTGVIYIAASAVIYGLISYFSRGIEASSALHIVNNLAELIMGGFGYGILTAEQTGSSTLFNIILKSLFLVFILYADKKLHWFEEVRYDDIEPFNAKHPDQKK
ncbi:MAG: CPBP family intramembrane metalloprotease [Solobacterium sp.]|nr:CPBP family intramembrane metalloprotease [Solobacterium sp.]